LGPTPLFLSFSLSLLCSLTREEEEQRQSKALLLKKKKYDRELFFLNFFPKPYTLNPKNTEFGEEEETLSFWRDARHTMKKQHNNSLSL